jgi:DNA-binding protein HU-beta
MRINKPLNLSTTQHFSILYPLWIKKYGYICFTFNPFINKHKMNKAELIESIASDAGLSKADSKKALDAFINATTKSLKKGDRVALVGFGSWSVSKRSARTGRNPQTGKEIKIPAKKVVKFKAGAELAGVIK